MIRMKQSLKMMRVYCPASNYSSYLPQFHGKLFSAFPFFSYLNVLFFAARFFLLILTIRGSTRIVFHVTKKRERTAPPTVRSFSQPRYAVSSACAGSSS